MKKLIYFLSVLILTCYSITSSAQSYCTPAYSGTGTASNFYTHVLRFAVGEINVTYTAPWSQTSPVYYNYSTTSTDLVKGYTYPVYIVVGNGGNTQTLSIWIDFNQNQSFESAERLFTKTDTANKGDHVIRVNITVPANAVSGNTRMRVGTVIGTGAPDPCNNNFPLNSQHFLDYTVNIVSPTVQIFQSATCSHEMLDEVTPSSMDNQILRIAVKTNNDGVLSPLTVDTLYFSSLGTTNPVEITNARVFFSGKSPEFRTVNQVGSTISNPGSYFKLAVNKSLQPGTNYFWLCYDISPTAIIGNVVDARCNGVYITTRRIPSQIDPSGNRRIGYCVAKGNKSEFVYVRRVTLGTINNFSYYSGTGYSDYTTMNTTLYKNAYHTLSVETGNGVNDNYAMAWIDFNRDGVFDNVTEKVIFDSIYGGSATNPVYGPVIDSFQVPLNAPVGPTRMRVVSHYDPAVAPFRIPATPCENPVEVGEVEDYAIIIADSGQPVANFTATTACLNNATYFTDQSYTFGKTYQITQWIWEFGDGDTSHQQNPSHIYKNPGVYNVKLKVNTNYPGSITGTIVKAVRVNKPEADFSITSNLYKSSIQFIDETSGGSSTNWYWDFGDPQSGYNNFSNTKNPFHTFDTVGKYTVTFIVTTDGGCKDTVKKTIFIDSIIAPVAEFSASSFNPYYNQKVIFQDLSVYSPSSWQWIFNPNTITFHDGTVSTSQNPHVSFNNTGTYTIKLIVRNSAGTDSIQKSLIVKNYTTPVADFTAAPLNVKAGQIVSFLDKSTNDPTTWQWSFGDQDSAFVQHPTHAYKTIGNFSVSLKAGNPAGSNSKTKPAYIKVTNEYQLGDADALTSNLFQGFIFDSGGKTEDYKDNSKAGFLIKPPCAGPISLTFSMFDYDMNDFLRVYDGEDNTGIPLFTGNGFTGANLPSAITAISGAMFIEEYTNAADVSSGFAASWYAIPNMKPNPKIKADTIGYLNGPVTFFNNTTLGAGNSYFWDYNNDGKIDDSNKINGRFTYTQLGTYFVKLIAKNCKGVDSFVHKIRIINPTAPPVADFYIEQEDTILELDEVQFYDNSTNGPTSWKWEVFPPWSVFYSKGTSDTSQNPVIMFLDLGAYNISLTATNSFGSSQTITKTSFIFVKTKARMCYWPFDVDFAAGRIFDSGGENGNYGPNENCGLLIHPCAEKVYLRFSKFDFSNNDYLRVYDGTDNTGKALHPGQGFTGSANPPILIAESGSMYIEEITNAANQATGFVADWYIKSISVPNASFSCPDTAYTGGYITNFTNTSTGRVDTAYWDYDFDGNPDDSSNYHGKYMFSSTGKKYVQLKAVNCAGSKAFTKSLIVVDPTKKPVTNFEAYPLAVDTSDIVTIKDLSWFGPNKWEWIFDPSNEVYLDSKDSLKSRPEIKITQPGLYDVSLVTSNAFGADTMTKSDYINVFAYCRPKVTNLIANFGISRVIISNINKSSSCGTVAYNDFTKEESGYFELGGTYDFTLYSTQAQYPFNRKIWIDYNQDGIFTEPTELAATMPNSTLLTWDGTLTIPKTALLGPTRMRIGVNSAGYSNSPCGPNNFGEYEDYRVIISNDKTAPVITVLGLNPYLTEIGYPYSDPGATAIDAVDGNISSLIVANSNVNTNVVGEYRVTYNVTDLSGNKAEEAVRKVFVTPDKTKPVISLLGKNPMEIGVYYSYVEPGALATDNMDGDVSHTLMIQHNIDSSRLDTFFVSYSAYDMNGNIADQVTRTVYVVDTSAPVIFIIGPDTARVENVGDPYYDSGAYVVDNYYQNLSVITSSNVNVNVAGYYWVRYNATDPSGNHALTKTRTVKVGIPPGYDDLRNENVFRIYPNPSNGNFFFYLDLPSKQEISIEVFNPLGNSVYKQNLGNRDFVQNEINLGHVTEGVYFIKTTIGNQILSKRITIVK